MNPGSPEMFGVALMAMWGTAGAVALGRSAAKSPAAREFAAAVRKMNLAAKGALVAGLVGAVAIGGTKPGGNDPQRQAAHPVSAMRTVAGTNAPPFALVEVRTNGVSFASATSNAIVSKTILRRGTSEGGEWIETETPFFRWGTNPVSRVFASQAVLSFGSMRHPALGATLPDGTPAESLVALRTPLGLVPEANGSRLAAPSRFWHEETAFGRVFTWENALLDRKADRPATVQIEARDDGDFAFRYDFSAIAPTNEFFIGAQLGPAAIEALGVRGGVTNAATVYRVDGAAVTSGVSVADFFTAPRLELRWRNVAGLGDLSGDTDGDGLSDWQEIHVNGTDPKQSDTDGDGLSDAAEILAGLPPTGYDADDDGLVDGIDPHPCVSDGNGFGTSELWVQCSFTNATEILSEGYDEYIARITGDSLPNPILQRGGARSESSPYRKLYILSASVPAIPAGRRVLVGVGDKRIVLASGGTFVFALEKGREYELVTDAPDLVTFGCEHPEPIIVAPTRFYSGRVFWRASGIEVDPPTWHFPQSGSFQTFSAICLDCHPSHVAGWSWTSDSPDLIFDTPSGPSCTIRWIGSSVPWGTTNFTVSCVNLGERVSKEVWVTFGDHTTPQTTLSAPAQLTIFVNDDDDDEDGISDWKDDSVAVDDDVVPVSFTLVQDNPVPGTVRIEPLSGASQFRAWSDLGKTAQLTWPIQLDVSSTGLQTFMIHLEAVAPSASVNGSRLRATFESHDGMVVLAQETKLTSVGLSRIEVPSAPSTGLAVLSGTQVGMQFDVSPLGAASLLSSDWRLARRMSNGKYHNWTTVASDISGRYWAYGFPTPGIYRISAAVTLADGATRTVHYLRQGIGPYDFRRVEPWNHVGVASNQDQLTLREFAVEQLGITRFSADTTLPAQNDFSSIPAGIPKCNAFVAFCAKSVHQNVPSQHGHPPFSFYPPLANDWAMGADISGWTFLGIGVDPEPGWICGHPDPSDMGHVGIVDYDGYGIAAGQKEVNRRYYLFLDGSCGYNKHGVSP